MVRTLFFSDYVRTLRVRYFAVRWPDYNDENKVGLSYAQQKFTKVNIECVIDSRKQSLKND